MHKRYFFEKGAKCPLLAAAVTAQPPAAVYPVLNLIQKPVWVYPVFTIGCLPFACANDVGV
jgi:hypothetical protein